MNNGFSELTQILSGELVVGSHESIVLLGSKAQEKLGDFSRAIANVIINDNQDLEYIARDIIGKIEKFQVTSKGKTKTFSLKTRQKQGDSLVDQYESLLTYIEKMKLILQLKETQLLKDSVILERLDKLICEVDAELEQCIAYGKTTINQMEYEKIEKYGMMELNDWKTRLERRLVDLQVSHTISLQSKEQLKLMQSSNRCLIDKILLSLSGTIPIWSNQITLLQGVEKLNGNYDIQEKRSEITPNFIIDNSEKANCQMKRKGRRREVNAEKFKVANDKLSDTLMELACMEETDKTIHKVISNLFI